MQTNEGGNVAQARTYADLLKDSHDADLFDHFATSELVKIDIATGEATLFDGARIHTRCDPSPDGAFVIMEELHRPFSYEIPCGRFPKRVWVVNRDGETGLVVPPGEAGALAGAIRELLSNPARAEALGRGASDRFDTTFHQDRTCEAYLELYREMTG